MSSITGQLVRKEAGGGSFLYAPIALCLAATAATPALLAIPLAAPAALVAPAFAVLPAAAAVLFIPCKSPDISIHKHILFLVFMILECLLF